MFWDSLHHLGGNTTVPYSASTPVDNAPSSRSTSASKTKAKSKLPSPAPAPAPVKAKAKAKANANAKANAKAKAKAKANPRPGFPAVIQDRVINAMNPEYREVGPSTRDYTTESAKRVNFYNQCREAQGKLDKFKEFKELRIGEKIFSDKAPGDPSSSKPAGSQRIEAVIHEAKVLLKLVSPNLKNAPQSNADSDKALANIIRTDHARLQAVADEIVCRFLRPSEVAMIYYTLTKPYNALGKKVSGADGKRLHVRTLNISLRFDDPEKGAVVGPDGRMEDLNTMRSKFVGRLEESDKGKEYPQVSQTDVYFNKKLMNNLIQVSETHGLLYVWFGAGGVSEDNKLSMFLVMPDYVDASDLRVDHEEAVYRKKVSGKAREPTAAEIKANEKMEDDADKTLQKAAGDLLDVHDGVVALRLDRGTMSMPVSRVSSKGITRPRQ